MLIVAAVVAGATTACANHRPDTPTGPSPPPFLIRSSARFVVRYTAIDAAPLDEMVATLEREHDRITTDLGVAQMPIVTVTLYPNREALSAGVAPLVGSIPSFASGLVTAVDAIHVVSPSAGGSFTAGVIGIVHEFAHCASMRINSTIGNNPRWLWETVALYEARQIVAPRSLPYLNGSPPPTFQHLNSLDNTDIYSVGGSFGEFIVALGGPAALADLVRSNGNLAATLSMTEADFIAAWLRFAGNPALAASRAMAPGNFAAALPGGGWHAR